MGRARLGRHRRLTLPERAAGALPGGRDRRPPRGAGGREPRPALAAAGRAPRRPSTAVAGDRAILVINRRGAASAVLCRDCGHVQACPECTRPLVYHQAGMTLRCHHCGAAAPDGRRAARPAGRRGSATSAAARSGSRPRSGSASRGLRVGRLDRDVVERRGAAARVVDAFTDGRLDVLVGTSLVTKGLDIPEVTLVGVVSADVALTLPDERAAERTYQLLVQAIGRAGSRRARPAAPSSRPTSPSTRRSGRPSGATRRPSTTPSWRRASGSGRRRSGRPSS